MNISYSFIYVLFLLTFLTCSNGLEPDSVAGTVTARILSFGILIAIYEVYSNYFFINYERCTEPWMKFNLNGLMSDFEEKVFGQHLVKDIVIQAVKTHMMKETPSKALVMSFHGCSGCGKNHISTLIAKNLFKKGLASKYFHLYLEMNFNRHDKVEQYKEKLRSDIERASSHCERNLFVFDEVDKMVPGVLDALFHYVNYYSKSDTRDYSKNTFIFLSNAGAANISNVALEFWAQGKDRESITLKDVEPLITQGAFNEIGGLQNSAIVHENLIDLYAPFLPLEKEHVRQCVRAELSNRKLTVSHETVEKVVDQLVYAPKEVERFAVSGCKKVATKVDLFAEN